ncbi:bifunctional glycosyltransferase family 2 protein/CDP-glycerol:glycerophosphate glycerophosphotransferase [Streptomyces sp. G1]|uniref:bifunctional glycosyltransferase/CDP-glycerol:glycerophosphate glycerophosphotransferase n=1 Tax=Streptomyces sp. G1 TaxID=361572 RepID=UPI002030CA1E|nr:bifunctional glycosyltransferase family 2 protein/CDP-glycerol:glycerophosphate glycerophosphotransferase [Streptomyces sp. G1]MCM1972694.1 CDP-glycerol glycerophosphotransferase family protein [Streptomyces sp. G1]
MPRFSVIVPAYKVQAYLHECLESVLTQSYTDLELVAVDDASPDACGAIVEEFAARDPRVRPVRLARGQGPGAARNAGLAEAGGDYVLFLDGGDTLTPGALQAVADRLKETGEPDVLVHDHAEVPWTGEPPHTPARPQLYDRGPAPFRPEDRPGLLRLPTAPWTKTCRREFLEREGLAFPPGSHEDTPWTFQVLLTAESVATLDRVCVHHRLRREGSGPSRRHFDVFEQYERVFAFLAERPELARWRPVLFRRTADHLTALFARGDLLPRAGRAEFLRLARDLLRRHRAPGTPVPPLRERLRHALVRLGLHRTYRALRTTAVLGRRTGKGAVKLAGALRAAALRLHYRIQLRLPLHQDRAVFRAYGGAGHGCNPGALEEAFRTHAPQLRTAWIAHPEHHHTVPVAARRITPGSAAYWTALARSKYVVDNEPRPLVKRPGQIVVQTFSGTPLKHMGLDLLERPAAGAGTDVGELLGAAGTWDYVVSANRHSTLVRERVLPGSYKTLEYGQPRNDVFQQATSAEVTRLRDALGIPEHAVAILYAPTHRDYRRTQHCPLDLDEVARRLGPQFVILARAHRRHGGPLAPEALSPRIVDVTGHPSVEQLCLASDALVTDYASVMFDYAGLDRPIVLHLDDEEAFEAARGTYVDLRAFPPGAIARSEDELVDIFTTGHWRGSRSTQLRSAFRARFCPYDDGRAAERVVRHVVFGERGLPPVVPPAERHPVPSAAARAHAPLPTVPRPARPLTLTDRL